MKKVEQGTTITLTGLAAGIRYKIAVQVVTSNTQSPYSKDEIVTTNLLQATEVEQLSHSLGIPYLRDSVADLEKTANDLTSKAASLATITQENKGIIPLAIMKC